MGLRTTLSKMLGNDPGQVVISKPNAHSSILNPLDTFQSKTLRQLRTGDEAQQLEILTEINSDPQKARQLFESNNLGVDNTKTVKLFRELIQLGSDEVRSSALETLFTYAGFKSGSLIKANRKGLAHEHADEILDHVKDFITAGDQESASSAASEMATKLGYHATHRKHAVASEEGGGFAKGNNFLYQLHAQGGAGRLIYDLLEETGIYEANQDLVATHFEQSAKESDPSVQNPLARKNIQQSCEKSIMGWMGSWSSCNFKFEYKSGDSQTTHTYDLEDFIRDTAQNGPEKACEGFVKHYTALVEYKESIRAKNPFNPFIKDIEKQQEKALKFIFDPNKLQANSREGQLIHAAISREMQEKGAGLFLSNLYKAVTQPNEMAEIKKIAIEYNRAFGHPLQYKDDSGNRQDVITMADYRTAQEQLQTGYKAQITRFAEASNLTISTRDDFTSQGEVIDQLAKTHKDNPTQFKTEVQAVIPGIAFPAVDPGDKELTSLLAKFAHSEISNTFTHFGEDHEVHIKRGGARGAIEALRTKDSSILESTEKLILDILNQDQRHEQEIRDGRDFAPSMAETLLRNEEHGVPSVASGIAAAQVLLAELDRRSQLAVTQTGHISADRKAKAEKFIKEEMLGLSTTTDVRTSPRVGVLLSRSNYQQSLLTSLDDHIQYHAKDRFGQEIKTFLSHTVPEAELEVIEASVDKLQELSDNLHSLQGATDHAERKRLEVANLKLLGITNSDNPLEADYTEIFGTLADPSADPSLVDIFIETIRQVMDMLKSGFDSKAAA